MPSLLSLKQKKFLMLMRYDFNLLLPLLLFPFPILDGYSSIIIFQVKTFSNDMKAVEEPLMSHVALQSSAEQKNFYDLLHFSPLKVGLSYLFL